MMRWKLCILASIGLCYGASDVSEAKVGKKASFPLITLEGDKKAFKFAKFGNDVELATVRDVEVKEIHVRVVVSWGGINNVLLPDLFVMKFKKFLLERYDGVVNRGQEEKGKRSWFWDRGVFMMAVFCSRP